MYLRKCLLSITVSFIFLSHSLSAQITVQGVVRDTDTAPVAGALVEVIDQANSSRVFSSTTNIQGQYTIQITTTGISNFPTQTPGKFNLLQNYPNPFNPSTVISYEIPHPVHVRIEIYNVLGQKIRTLFDGYQTNLFNRVIWDGTNDQNLGVAAGVYIYSLITDECRINRKMLILDGHSGNTGSGVVTANQPGLSKVGSNFYNLRVNAPDIETYTGQNLQIIANTTLDVTVTRITTLTDIDGNVYKTVKIGEQLWMAENLNVTHYRNGDPIPNVYDDAEWSNLTTGAYCYFDNNTSYVTDYGALYNWYAVSDSRNIAPVGWHLPTDEEWKQLEMALGMSRTEADSAGYRGTDEGNKMKESGNAHWASPNTGATNESGFTARPGGYRFSETGQFYNINWIAIFWSTTIYQIDPNTGPWYRGLNYDGSRIFRYYDFGHFQVYGYSVRCVRDYQKPPNVPTLLSPVNCVTGLIIDPTLTWSAQVGADSYKLQVAKTSDFTALIYDIDEIVSPLYQISGLEDGTNYYWRVCASNDKGTSAWSEIWSFTTKTLNRGTVTDIDGNIYQTVKIGEQWWMAENLKVTHFRNGDAIPNVTSGTEWSSLLTGAFCYYKNDSSYSVDYGILYNWFAVGDSRNLAPAGWHVPTDTEWQILLNYLGGDEIAGNKLKETGAAHWNNPIGATNESGFTARPGSARDYFNGNFHNSLGIIANFWTTTEWSTSYSWARLMYSDLSIVGHDCFSKQFGFSVRLVKD